MEPQSALVGTYRAVELDAVAYVYVDLSLVVNPGNTERYDALGLYDALHDLSFLKLRVLVIDILY